MANIYVFILILICLLNIELSPAEKELSKLKGIVKTIHGKYDIVDCVDIHQQPALDHPLLKDHKIQMMPPLSIRPQSNASEEAFFYQIRLETDTECPEGTVPIKRFEKVDDEAFLMNMKGLSIHSINASKTVSNNHRVYEFATAGVDEGTYYGTQFAATLWNPHVEPNEFSLAKTWITAGPDNARNSIEVGWGVYPLIYGDYQTRLHTFWTTDGYRTGCYDLRCPGFVQLSRKIFPAAPIAPISQYGSDGYALYITVYKAQGNWYLQVNGELVGYWNANIFPHLRGFANRLVWGGGIVNERNGGHHTLTQMGSGHFAYEKYSKAGAFFNLQVNTREDKPVFQRPGLFYPLLVSNGNCYSLVMAECNRNYGDHFFFGGPGYSSNCP